MDPVDVLIVGSGASGAAAAWSLSRDPSLRILCLEAGERTEPSRYPAAAADWELARLGEASPLPGHRAGPADYPVDDAASPIAIANFNGFGGGTILYSGHFPRMHPSDFAVRSLDGVGEDWPFGYEALEPYFTLNEEQMGVAGLVGDPASPGYERLLPPAPLGPMGRRIAKGFNRLGWHWWPSYAAINTKSHAGRAPCVNLGPCNTGCAQGAKSSVDVTYWPKALQQGVEVRTGWTALRVVLGEDGRVAGVDAARAGGETRFFPARAVALACGGIGTPRLLLNSTSQRFPNGLLNDHDQVGRRLMLHPLGYVEAVFEQDLQSSIGPQGCCLLSQEFYETDETRGFKRGYTLQVLRGAPPAETAVAAFVTRRLPLGPDHHDAFAGLFNHTGGIAVIAEDLPEPDNRVELDPGACDAAGMPGVTVRYALSENTKSILAHGLERSREVLEAAGGRVVSAFAPVRNTGWHLMGSARMGADPKTSVVNASGQAHAVENLFILDMSVFPTSGAVNPVATAQAVTLKFCDDLRSYLRQAA